MREWETTQRKKALTNAAMQDILKQKQKLVRMILRQTKLKTKIAACNVAAGEAHIKDLKSQISNLPGQADTHKRIRLHQTKIETKIAACNVASGEAHIKELKSQITNLLTEPKAAEAAAAAAKATAAQAAAAAEIATLKTEAAAAAGREAAQQAHIQELERQLAATQRGRAQLREAVMYATRLGRARLREAAQVKRQAVQVKRECVQQAQASAAQAAAATERLQQQRECGICKEDPDQRGGLVAFLPCGHMLCAQCAEACLGQWQNVGGCPFCRGDVTAVQRLYKP